MYMIIHKPISVLNEPFEVIMPSYVSAILHVPFYGEGWGLEGQCSAAAFVCSDRSAGSTVILILCKVLAPWTNLLDALADAGLPTNTFSHG
jgi:hypothetical protein